MMPTKCWHAKTPVEIPVRSKSVPRKQSRKEGFFCSNSSWTVVSISASLDDTSVALPYSLCRDLRAFSTFPTRTKYHGDSGAKASPAARNAAKKSWMANGPLYAHLSVLSPKPLITELEINCPRAMPRLTPAVEMPRRTTGVISEHMSGPSVR